MSDNGGLAAAPVQESCTGRTIRSTAERFRLRRRGARTDDCTLARRSRQKPNATIYLMMKISSTILEIAGVDTTITVQKRDGISFLPLLTGKVKCPPVTSLALPAQLGPFRSRYRRHLLHPFGEWKLVYYFDSGKHELFQYPADISEKHDVAAENPKLVKKLSKS